MERKRFLAVVMTVMMVISMIPSMVFAAAPSGELGGKLKIKGLASCRRSSECRLCKGYTGRGYR
ncbi:hypothetical protein M5E86_11640 [Blautia wexlerae]|nr:hypothetical protein M5E86_11640 [Blautia wexlerae]